MRHNGRFRVARPLGMIAGGVVWLMAATAAADLIGAWTFDSASSPGRDASDFGHHAQLRGTTWGANGRLNAAIEMDGLDDYVSVSLPGASIPADFTLATWVQRRAGGRRSILGKGDALGGEPFSLYLDADGILSLGLGQLGGWPRQVRSFGFTPPLHDWTHLLLTADHSQRAAADHSQRAAADHSQQAAADQTDDQTAVTLLVNGEPSQTVIFDAPRADTGEPLLIGGGPADPFHFDGHLDDVAVWNQKLSLGKARAVHQVAVHLGYNAAQAQRLFDAFDAGPGASIEIGDRLWHYAASLPGSPGDVIDGPGLVLDDGGHGLIATPEPHSLTATLVLIGLTLACRAGRSRGVHHKRLSPLPKVLR